MKCREFDLVGAVDADGILRAMRDHRPDVAVLDPGPPWTEKYRMKSLPVLVKGRRRWRDPRGTERSGSGRRCDVSTSSFGHWHTIQIRFRKREIQRPTFPILVATGMGSFDKIILMFGTSDTDRRFRRVPEWSGSRLPAALLPVGRISVYPSTSRLALRSGP